MILIGILAFSLLPQEKSDSPSSIRDILTENFRILTSEERAVLEVRIERAISRLDSALRDNALRHARDCTISATVFLKRTDEYREVAAKYPQLLPLVLPDDYHRSAYLAAVDRIEADIERAVHFAQKDPANLAEVGLQLEALRTIAKDVAGRRLTGIQGAAADLAYRQIDEIVDGFKGLQKDPFFWMESPLDQAGYASVIAALGEKIGTLPILMPGGERPEDADPANAPVTEVSRVEALIASALKPLYQFPRLSRPKSFEARNKITRLEADARTWMAEAKLRHEHLYTEILMGRFPKVERLPSTESKTRAPVLGDPKEEDALPAPRSGRAAASADHPAKQSHSRSVGLALIAVLMVALFLIFYWRAILRKPSTN